MPTADWLSIAQRGDLVIAGGLLLGAAFGAISQRSGFCVMGALADQAVYGSTVRLRMWALAIAVALLGSAGLQAGGLIDLQRTIYAANRLPWLAQLVGGLLFGAGMVLASGCAGKTLVRLGGGEPKALLVSVSVAIGALLTMKGALSGLRIELLEAPVIVFERPGLLPELLFDAPQRGFPVLAVTVALALGGWALARRDERRMILLSGGGIGLLIPLAWIVSGVAGYLPEHPETLQETFLLTNSGRMEALSFVAPQAYGLELLLWWSDRGRQLTFGIAGALGVVLGSFLAAWPGRQFARPGPIDRDDLIRHLGGGLLMGIGGVLGLGCTIGQGISGLAVLSLGACLTTSGIVLGARLMLHYTLRRTNSPA